MKRLPMQHDHEERPFDIVVAGEINPDLILRGDVEPSFGQVEKMVSSAHLVIGSSSAIFACGAARLGLRVAFIGVCGDDVFGHFMLTEMHKRGVDVKNVIIRSDGDTGLSVILTRGSDRAILTHPGLIAALCAEDVTDHLLSQARHLHVASYFLQVSLQSGLSELYRRAHTLGLSTSLDTNYDPSGKWSGLDELLSGVDIFLPNELEALSLSQRNSMEEALEALSKTCEVVAVKLGAQGAMARSGRKQVRVPSIPVSVADTVGAGDSFDAGFLYGWLKDWSLERALKLACICGALSTQQTGGTQGQPTLEEAMQHVAG